MPAITLPGNVKAHLAVPPVGAGPWPGVVVLHEAFGLNDDIRQQADRLAAAGYLAVAPDLFSAGGAWRCLRATFRAVMTGRGRPSTTSRPRARWLAAREDCSGRIGVIGFCLGGGFALLTAARGFDAAAPNYAHLPKDLDGALEGACPVVASYGGKDKTLRGTAATLDGALARAGVPHDVQRVRRTRATPSSTATTSGRAARSCGWPASATTSPRRRTPGAGSCASSRRTCAPDGLIRPVQVMAPRADHPCEWMCAPPRSRWGAGPHSRPASPCSPSSRRWRLPGGSSAPPRAGTRPSRPAPPARWRACSRRAARARRSTATAGAAGSPRRRCGSPGSSPGTSSRRSGSRARRTSPTPAGTGSPCS